jgi:hypothetical protein
MPNFVSVSLMSDLNETALVLEHVSQKGFDFIPAETMIKTMRQINPQALSDFEEFASSWHDMPLDTFMADGGRYRRRRYAVLSTDNLGKIQKEPHQPHYQSLDYNHLNGGIARDFEPMMPSVIDSMSMQTILSYANMIFSQLMPNTPWHIECHQFRIETNHAGQGKPTPEGVHCDGVEFVLVMMIKRQNISSGTTTLHDMNGNIIDRFTLTEPFDVAVVNDKRCMHGVTPITPIDSQAPAYRDVLVITFKKK